MPVRMSRISSARRRPPPRGRVLLVASAVVALAILGMMLRGHRQAEPPVPPRPALPQPTAVRPTPSPTPTPETPTPTPSPRPVRVEGSTFIELPAASPTPPLTPTPETGPAPRRLSECLTIESSSARQSVAAWGRILVEVEVGNHCGRDLEPLEVWVEVAGYRDGSLVQSVRGHPFEELRDGDSAEVTIGLPGSLDWYDRVAVRVVPQ